MCAVAATTSFPEPFITPPGAKRLTYKHRNFAGQRYSDHIAMLQAYQQWEHVRLLTVNCLDVIIIHFVIRLNGEIAERQFCDEHLLSLPTLGMASEAKVLFTIICVDVIMILIATIKRFAVTSWIS